MNYNFKYAKRPMFLLVAVLWGVTGVSLAVLIGVFVLEEFNELIITGTILLMILCMINASIYITIYLGRRDYIVLRGQTLYIDQGLIYFKKRVSIKHIKDVRTIGHWMRLNIGDIYEERINLDVLSISDIKILEGVIEKRGGNIHGKIYK